DCQPLALERVRVDAVHTPGTADSCPGAGVVANSLPRARAPLAHLVQLRQRDRHRGGWSSGRSRSFTAFTGLNTARGTSTNTVFQWAIEPFHRPGRSSAIRSRPARYRRGESTRGTG